MSHSRCSPTHHTKKPCMFKQPGSWWKTARVFVTFYHIYWKGLAQHKVSVKYSYSCLNPKISGKLTARIMTCSNWKGKKKSVIHEGSNFKCILNIKLVSLSPWTKWLPLQHSPSVQHVTHWQLSAGLTLIHTTATCVRSYNETKHFHFNAQEELLEESIESNLATNWVGKLFNQIYSCIHLLSKTLSNEQLCTTATSYQLPVRCWLMVSDVAQPVTLLHSQVNNGTHGHN